MANFTRWERPDRVQTLFKPAKGSGILAREAADKARKDKEQEVAKLVKERDGYRCRWPEPHKCRPVGAPLEAAHIRDKSLCGETETRNEITVCRWIHRAGPESIHGKQLRVECETDAGADAALSFWKQGEDGTYFCIARELAPGVVEKD